MHRLHTTFVTQPFSEATSNWESESYVWIQFSVAAEARVWSFIFQQCREDKLVDRNTISMHTATHGLYQRWGIGM